MTKILIVDDDRHFIQQVRELLAGFGYESGFVTRAEHLFPKLEREEFSLILLDINMPSTDGVTLLKQLRSTPPYQTIPVIMLTVEAAERVLANCFEYGATDFITKPVQNLVFKARVESALAIQTYIKALEERTADLNQANTQLQQEIAERVQAEETLQKYRDHLEELVETRTVELLEAVAQLEQEISERKRAEEMLREVSEFNKKIISESPIGISIYDTSGQCVAANDSIGKLIGATREQVLEQNYKEIESWKKSGLFDKAKEAISENIKKRHELHIVSTFGRLVSLDCHFIPFPSEDQSHLLFMMNDISERIQMENALRESEERFRTIVTNSTPIVFMFDREGTILLSEGKMLSVVGLRPGEVVGQSVFELYQDYPDTIKAFKTALNGELVEGIIKFGELFFETFFSPNIDLQGNVVGVIGMSLDITEYKRAEKAIQNANNQLAQRVEELSTLNQISQKLSTVIDLEANLKTLNKTMVQFFKARNSIAAMLNQAGTELVVISYHDQDRTSMNITGLTFPLHSNRAGWQVIETKRSVLVTPDTLDLLDEMAQKQFKERNIYSVMILPLLTRGKAIGTLSIGTDQTGRIFTPSEISLAETIAAQIAGAIETSRLFDELREAKDAAEAANRAKTIFISSMSHELRTPLNGILGYTQILAWDKKLDDSHKARLEIIQQNGNHLLNLINDILDFSKMEAERMKLFESNFAFQPFIENIVAMVKLQADKKNIWLNFEAGPNLPIAVHSDEKRLSQIILNLLNNAIKFTERGSITFSVHRRVKNSPLSLPKGEEASSPALWEGVRGRADSKVPNSVAGKIRFQVADTGTGIPQNKLTDIFLPFKQVGEQALMIEGTGLGLPISRNLTRLLGGELHVKSRLGEGSTFWFDLNLDEVDTWREVQTVEEQNIIGFEGEKRKILVVDDVFHNQGVLVNILEPLGFDVITANDGREGLSKAIEFQPDLVLMDLVMPIMDGVESTQLVKKNLPNTKVIIVSARSSQALADVQKRVGGDDYLQKPIRMVELFSKLQIHLNLTWIHEKEEEHYNLKSDEKADIIPPPITELIPLLESAQLSDFMEIETQLIQIEAMGKKYKPFVARVQEFVELFDADDICEFVARYLF
ncbi:response regulator [Anaerolineales bacterium HSG24]|nr:response regulator [Anaerolineales bacterium HSG24]